MRASLALMALSFLACGKSTDGSDTGPSGDSGDGPTTGILPDQPAHAGVAYVVHYGSDKLVWTRTDKDKAVAGGTFQLEGLSHSMALDSVNDRLAVVHDLKGTVNIYSLDRPKNSTTPLEDPELLNTIKPDDIPLFARFDPYHERFYVFTVNTDSGTSAMHIYTDKDGKQTKVKSFQVAVSAAWDIDPVRQLLFIYDSSTGGVHVYDLHDDNPVELPGSPLPFSEWYPEENNWAFSVRNLRADPWSARVYAGRPQGTLSELMAFSYPDAIPAGATSYGDLADLGGVTKLEDAFDVSVSHEERPYLLEAHTALPDSDKGLVFLAGRAWNGDASTDLILPLDENLDFLDGCEDDENGWCWLYHYTDGNPGAYLYSEGAACIDTSNQVVVSTTVDFFDDESNGQIVLFSYEANGKMTPLLKSDGKNPTASVYPIDTVCH